MPFPIVSVSFISWLSDGSDAEYGLAWAARIRNTAREKFIREADVPKAFLVNI